MFAVSDATSATRLLYWRVQPGWGWKVASLTLAFLGCLSVAWLHWAAGLILLACIVVWYRSAVERGLWSCGILLRTQGGWHYRQAWSTRHVRLSRAWFSPLWITLRFESSADNAIVSSTESSGATFEITLCKSGLPVGAWQRLCMQVTQDLQFPNGGQLDRA